MILTSKIFRGALKRKAIIKEDKNYSELNNKHILSFINEKIENPIDTATRLLKETIQKDNIPLIVIDMEKDGNCLYASIADQMEKDPSKFQKYKDIAIETIMKYRTEFGKVIQHSYRMEVNEYLESVREKEVWGGEVEMWALGIALNVQIFNYFTSKNKTGTLGVVCHPVEIPQQLLKLVKFGESSKIINLGYVNSNHYVSLRPIEEIEKKEKRKDIKNMKVRDMLKEEIIQTYGIHFEDFMRKEPNITFNQDKKEINWKLIKNKELFQKYLDILEPTMLAPQENSDLNDSFIKETNITLTSELLLQTPTINQPNQISPTKELMEPKNIIPTERKIEEEAAIQEKESRSNKSDRKRKPEETCTPKLTENATRTTGGDFKRWKDDPYSNQSMNNNPTEKNENYSTIKPKTKILIEITKKEKETFNPITSTPLDIRIPSNNANVTQTHTTQDELIVKQDDQPKKIKQSEREERITQNLKKKYEDEFHAIRSSMNQINDKLALMTNLQTELSTQNQILRENNIKLEQTCHLLEVRIKEIEQRSEEKKKALQWKSKKRH